MHKIEVQFSQNLARFAVSLFTREWIEIRIDITSLHINPVSLFTREWIEMVHDGADGASAYGLPLDEGVD